MAEITREHLERAALAAGIEPECRHTSGAYYYDDPETGREEWRPHRDDCDAARLAVHLDISMTHSICPPRWIADHHSLDAVHSCVHDGTAGDRRRAWREAVTLCAAAVGERMQLAQRTNATPEQVAGSLQAVDEFDAAKRGER